MKAIKTLCTAGFIIAFTISFATLVVALYQNDVNVSFDGTTIDFTDQGPVIDQGRTLVPIRDVFEAVGFEVDWDQETRTVTLENPTHTINIAIDSEIFTTNGTEFTLDVPAQIINDRTLLPIRFPLESVGFFVDWDDDLRTVIIETNGDEGLPGPLVYHYHYQGTTPATGEQGAGAGTQGTTGNQGQINPWFRYLENTRSDITIPNRRLTDQERQNWIAEYNRNGGATNFELEVVRLVNQIRQEYGLHPLIVHETLSQVARFYSQTMSNLQTGLGHDRGPYVGPHNRRDRNNNNGILAAFGFMGSTGGNGISGRSVISSYTSTPESFVAMWMGSPGHRSNILGPTYTHIGVGFYLGHPYEDAPLWINTLGYQLFYTWPRAFIRSTGLPQNMNSLLIGEQFNMQIAIASRGQTSWSISQGSLPPGLSLQNPTSHSPPAPVLSAPAPDLHAVISGVPTQTGTFNFTLRVENPSNVYVERNFTITVISEPSPVITSSGMPSMRVGESFSWQAQATSTGPVTWSISQGALPQGIQLDPQTGQLSGTPTQVGRVEFTMRAQNAGGYATRNHNVNVLDMRIPQNTGTMPHRGRVGTAFTFTPGDPGTMATWSIATGSLPEGLQLNSATGAITGTPTTSGNFTFTLRVENQAGHRDRNFSLIIDASEFAPVIQGNPAGSRVGENFNWTPSTSGHQPIISWSLTAGSLPPGLQLNQSTGQISGIPTQTGRFDFTLRAENAYGIGTRNFAMTVQAAQLPQVLTNWIGNNGRVGEAFSFTLSASAGIDTIWGIASGSLPPGLHLDATTGVISGVPTQQGGFSFGVYVRNAVGVSNTVSLSINVQASLTLNNMFWASIPTGRVDEFFSAPVASISGGLPITFTITMGSLPPGLMLDPTTGAITGLPAQSGNFSFSVMAQNSEGSFSVRDFSLFIEEAPAQPPILEPVYTP